MRLTKTAIREAHWIVENITPGTPWVADSFQFASTQAGLIQMGVLVRTDDPRLLAVAAVSELPPLPESRRKRRSGHPR